jgi:LacI family transcriptional regulator
MATIKDVAAIAGISYTTVSHVLNRTRPVSDEVRKKVEAAIKRNWTTCPAPWRVH